VSLPSNPAITSIDAAMTKLFTAMATIYDIQTRGDLTRRQTASCHSAEASLQQIWTHLVDAKSTLQH
jgi:hypothetical protein